MRDALWPGSPQDHEDETRKYFEDGSDSLKVFVAESGGRVIGFLELDYRKYAPGCESSPVPFIEGWYVEPEFRGRGFGRALVKACEDLAVAEGYREIASDVDMGNETGLGAHRALGYDEIERIVCFRRSL